METRSEHALPALGWQIDAGGGPEEPRDSTTITMYLHESQWPGLARRAFAEMLF
jgi:hypothetical protein